MSDARLVSECLAGALYLEDFRRLVAAQGCKDARFVSISDFSIVNEEIEQQVGNTRFYSVTYAPSRCRLRTAAKIMDRWRVISAQSPDISTRLLSIIIIYSSRRSRSSFAGIRPT